VASYRIAIAATIYETDDKGAMLAIRPEDAPSAIQKCVAEAIWSASVALQKQNADLTLLAAVDEDDLAGAGGSK